MIGVQKRLNNLDFPCGKVTGEINDQTRAALKNFQRRLGMEVTGEIDQATREHLVKYHDTNESLPEEPQVTTTVKKQQAVEQVIEADLPTQPNAMTVEEGMNEEDFDI
jgi:peptidoglycan hydrolase-like protein with peptidoglycan-binding domain